MDTVTPAAAAGTRLLTVEDVANMLGCSRRTVHERTRRDAIPHRVLPHGRRCLFDEDELRAWMDGAELERVDLAHGGRVVRVKPVLELPAIEEATKG